MTQKGQTPVLNPAVADAAPQLTLVVQDGPQAGTPLPCRRVVSLLGAREGCKLTLRHDRVSPVHVAIVNDGTQVVAVDLATDTGTMLNGLKMAHEALKDGDVLTISPWELRVEIRQPAHTGTADLHPFGLDPTPRLVVLEHLATGRILQSNRDVCLIGRRHGCDIVVDDTRVSRVHALLASYFGRPIVFDLRSRNTTLVNDEPVEFRLLENEDILTIGESRFRVRLVGSSVAGGAREGKAEGKAAVEATVALTPEERAGDLVDIQATEGAQRWHVAESLEKATGKR